MEKFLKRFSVLVISLFCLSVFGWVVKHQSQGDALLGDKVGKGLMSFVSFLDLFEQTVEEVQKLPETFVPTPADFEAINKLDQDVFALISYSNEDKGRSVEIRNLRTEASLHRWDIPNPFQAHDRIMDPLLLPGKRLVYSYNGVTGLFCLDSTGTELWKQDTIAHHHSLNLDSAGNIWACSYTKENGGFIIYRAFYDLDGRELVYIDNTITQLDPNTGKILFHKSISEILLENNLEEYIIKSANIEDPIHLNDVQPALKTTAWYNEGDVFLSFRNSSALMHYRPSNNQVIRIIEGAFYSQHDIDFLNDSTLIFFNNNSHTHWSGRPGNWRVADSRIDMGDFHSNTMAYDLKNEKLFVYEAKAFSDNGIFTFTEGMQEVLADGSLWIEEQNSGKLWVIKEGEVIYKQVLKSHHPGHHHLPNWTRILTSQP